MRVNTATIIVRGGKEYVLQHRDDIPAIADPGTYSPWGGRVEPEDESHEAGAVREVAEETGLEFPAKALLPLGEQVVDSRTPGEEGYKLVMKYYAIEVPAELQIQCLEGQGIKVLAKPYRLDPKLNSFAVEAMKRYEAR